MREEGQPFYEKGKEHLQRKGKSDLVPKKRPSEEAGGETSMFGHLREIGKFREIISRKKL